MCNSKPATWFYVKRLSRTRFKRGVVAAATLVTVAASSGRAWAASCCGGGFAAPGIIAGDERAQLTATYATGTVHADVSADNLWYRRGDHERTETMRLEGAHLLGDRWQLGGAVPIVRRTRNAESSAGLGDVSVTGAYEYLPDWDYHPWRPKGIGFLMLTAPTGPSIYESADAYLSARGRGFWSVGVGTLLTKTFGRWDAVVNAQVHRSLPRAFSNSAGNGRLIPGFGEVVDLGAGYNLGDYRVGATLSWTYEDAIAATGTVPSAGSPERFMTGGLSVSRVYQREWAFTLSYADQTLFGSPSNTSLSRTVTLLVQRRWLR